MDEYTITHLFNHYLSGVDYKIICLVSKKWKKRANTSFLFWRARIRFLFPKGNFQGYIKVDPEKFVRGSESNQRPITQEIIPNKHVVYVSNVKEKFNIMEKLQKYEDSRIFSAQEIISFYFVSREKTLDKSMRIEEDLWQRMISVTHKWGVSSILHDIELVQSAQVSKNAKIQIVNKLMDNNGDIVQTVLQLL